MADPSAARKRTRPGAGGAGAAEAGQAQVELVAAVPLLLAATLVVLQLLAAGFSQTLADGAAEAGALAAAAGREPEAAVRSALPGWAERRVRVHADDGLIQVELVPPTPIPGLARHLTVGSEAWARPAPPLGR
jgi:hypothetical protein